MSIECTHVCFVVRGNEPFLPKPMVTCLVCRKQVDLGDALTALSARVEQLSKSVEELHNRTIGLMRF